MSAPQDGNYLEQFLQERKLNYIRLLLQEDWHIQDLPSSLSRLSVVFSCMYKSQYSDFRQRVWRV